MTGFPACAYRPWIIASLTIVTLAFCGARMGRADDEARLLRFPAIHGDQIVFTYAGDLYSVALAGRRRPQADQRPRLRDVCPLLAGRQVARLHRPVRRQHRGLPDAGRGRRAQAADLHGHAGARRRLRPHGTEQHRAGLAEREDDHLPLAGDVVQRLRRPTLHGVDRRRPARAASAAARRLVLLFARQEATGLQPRLPRVPHLEAVSRRHGRRHLDLRFRRQDHHEPHQQPGQRRLSHVARRRDLLPFRPGRKQADEPVRLRLEDEGHPAAHALQRTSTSSSRRWATRRSSSRTAASSIVSTSPRSRRQRCPSIFTKTWRPDAADWKSVGKEITSYDISPDGSGPSSARGATSSPCRPSTATRAT